MLIAPPRAEHIPPLDAPAWDEHRFHGISGTDYRIETHAEDTVLHARCRDSASMYWLRRRIPLENSPVLRWRWRIDSVYDNPRETEKSGDDFPARVYVAVRDNHGAVRAINYVWASHTPVGTAWPSPYTDKSYIAVVRTGTPANPGEWIEQARDVRADFRQYHGLSVTDIDGLALMSDCDNLGTEGHAEFLRPRFSHP